jgi:hypothetical protein
MTSIDTICELFGHYDNIKLLCDTKYENEMKELFMFDVVKDLDDDFYMFMVALYYKFVKRDKKKVLEYLIKSSDKENQYAMLELGHYYENIEKNYDLMEKYYLMAIDKGNVMAMSDLGHYYFDIKNYDLMKKYWSIAMDKGYCAPALMFGSYYIDIEKNYSKAKICYIKFIEEKINEHDNNSRSFLTFKNKDIGVLSLRNLYYKQETKLHDEDFEIIIKYNIKMSVIGKNLKYYYSHENIMKYYELLKPNTPSIFPGDYIYDNIKNLVYSE